MAALIVYIHAGNQLAHRALRIVPANVSKQSISEVSFPCPQATIAPTKAGVVTLSASIGGTAIGNSPQDFKINPAVAHAPSSTFQVAATTIAAGGTLAVTAGAVDVFGNRLVSSGQAFKCASHSVVYANAVVCAKNHSRHAGITNDFSIKVKQTFHLLG